MRSGAFQLVLLCSATACAVPVEPPAPVSDPGLVEVFANRVEPPVPSAYQGLSVSVAAIRMLGRWYCADWESEVCADTAPVLRSGGQFGPTGGAFMFDPDAVGRGRPGLEVRVSDMGGYEVPSLVWGVTRYVMRGSLPRFLREAVGERPYRTYSLRDPASGRRQRMDLWLQRFVLTVGANPRQPSTSLRDGTIPDDAMTVFGTRVRELPDDEWGERFDPLTILLRIEPRSERWWSEPSRLDGIFERDDSLRFAVGAVEAVAVSITDSSPEDDGDGGQTNEFGFGIDAGQGVHLFFDPETLGFTPLTDLPRLPARDAAVDYGDLGRAASSGRLVEDRTLFGRPAYVPIPIANIGSWDRRRLFNLFGDAGGDHARVEFLVHLFSLGEWELRRPDPFAELAGFRPTTRTGPLDFLIRGTFWGKLFGWTGLLALSGVTIYVLALALLPALAGGVGAAFASSLGLLAAGLRRPFRRGRSRRS